MNILTLLCVLTVGGLQSKALLPHLSCNCLLLGFHVQKTFVPLADDVAD